MNSHAGLLNSARERHALLLAAREDLRPMLLLVQAPGEMREPAIGERGAQLFVTVCAAGGRIDSCSRKY